MKRILLILFVFACLPGYALTFKAYNAITTGSIPQYTKFEAGAQIDITPPTINPYDPSVVKIWAVFMPPSTPGRTITVNGFWYQEFSRNTSIADPTQPQACGFSDVADNWLTRITTTPWKPWRIRFSPSEVGQWTYKIYASYGGTTISTPSLSFNCVASSDPGYVTTDVIARATTKNRVFLFKKTGDLFYPRGLNTTSPVKSSMTYNRIPYTLNSTIIPQLAQNGGNMIRVMMNPEQFQIEWIEDGVGNYDTRQDRAFDLDEIFRLAEINGIYIQLCIDVQSELYPDTNPLHWDKNPYKSLVSNPKDFFTNANCKDYYKRKLQYIIARWGYSTHLLGYELYNEVDQFSPDYWSGSTAADVTSWHNEMLVYGKTLDNANHLFTTSTTGPSFSGLYDLANIDYTSVHYYFWDFNSAYQNNIIERGEASLHKKPMIFGEIGEGTNPSNCGVGTNSFMSSPIFDQVEFHNSMWSTSFGGGAGPGAYWTSINDVIKPSCWGGQYRYYKPLSVFLSGEDEMLKNGKPIANTCSSVGPKDIVHGGINHSIDPNNNLPSWWFLNTDPNFYTPFVVSGISTSNDDNLQVFALKEETKIIGWVANKKNYWYGLPHKTDASCSTLVDNMPMTYPGGVTSLSQQTISIQNVCKGQYKVEFYSTYSGYDINGDSVPDDGGLISSLTIPSAFADCDGVLTFTIPSLVALSSGTNPNAPDYGFKVTKIGDNWSHHIVTPGNGTYFVNYPGSIVAKSNHIFYTLNTGTIYHYYPTGTFTWQGVTLNNINNGEAASLTNQSIAVNSDATHVFYMGSDSRVHHYYYSNGQWIHELLPNSGDNTQNISGSICVSDDGTNVYYQGVDSRLQHYHNNAGTWVHEWLTDWSSTSQNIAGSISVDGSGLHVFYKGVDAHLHHYFYGNGQWNHGWLTSWVDNSQDVGGKIIADPTAMNVYYAGIDNRLHHYYYAGNGTWTHELFTYMYNGQIIYDQLGGDFTVSNDGTHIFYKGVDGYMNQRYRIASSGALYQQYAWDLLICNLTDDRKVRSYVAGTDNDKVFYNGNDNELHAFLFNDGCDVLSIGHQQRKYNVPTDGLVDNTVNNIPGNVVVNIYPNPFKDIVTIDCIANTIVKVDLKDIYGRILISSATEGNKIELNAGHLPAGIYIVSVQLKNSDEIKTFKIIKE